LHSSIGRHSKEKGKRSVDGVKLGNVLTYLSQKNWTATVQRDYGRPKDDDRGNESIAVVRKEKKHDEYEKKM